MPPRRATRASVAPATTTAPPKPKATRGKKPAAPVAPASDESDASKGGFPGESDEEEEETVKPVKKATTSRGRTRKVKEEPEEEEVVVKPVSKRASAGQSKAVPVETTRRSTRASLASTTVEDEDDEEQAEAEDVTPVVKKVAPKKAAAVRGRKKVVESESESEEPAGTPTKRPRLDNTAHTSPMSPPGEERKPSIRDTPPSTSAPSMDTPAVVESTENDDSEDGSEDADTTIRLPTAQESDEEDISSPPETPIEVAPPPSLAPVPPPAPTGPKPRLTIHKIVLINFKSYAGRQEIGPFHKSFSAIVGPNGSGKSNTIDALLFVFGYRASKMRQGKVSELIHNSAGKEGLESCAVEVWFREIVDLPGVDKFLLVPNSQLIVTRTAYRNNSSKYSINNRNAGLAEVTTLLKGKGIDLDHNRFLILQGEVESIAQMKAKAMTEHEDGLLEYLEDIIGTTSLKGKIETAQLEVDALSEERGEKMNRLRMVEREKSSLEEKKREAEDYLRDTNDLTRKKSLLWQFHQYTLTNNIEITSKAIGALETELGEEQQLNAGHLTEIEDLQKAYDVKLEAYKEVERIVESLTKEIKKFEKEEVGLSEKKKHLSTKQKKFKKSLSDDAHARSEALSAIENCGSELEQNRKKVADLEKKLLVEEAELEEIRDSLRGKTDVFTTQIETKQRELEPWTAKISDKQSAIDVATSERDLLAQKATGVQAALEEAATALQNLKDGDTAKQSEYATLKKEAVKVKKQLTDSEAKLEAMGTKTEQLRGKVTAARQKADEAKSSLAADKSENAVLGSLTKLKDQGRIRGFHGRLGDLGVIDDKYDVAITTACGALNNLVVDTVEQGQACIEHLRKGNVGRASFMILEKLPPRDLGPIETPENVPRLFDLIKPKDPRFAPAFYKAIFNTLVANDLEQAQRIGYGKKRWRVVTLAGQLIDPSGTMSGGGSKVSRGGMSSKFAQDKVAPEVVARYEKESGFAQDELEAFFKEKKEAELEVNGLRKRLPEIEMALEKIELDVQTGSKRIAEAEKRLAELKSQSKPDAADETRIKSLDKDIAALTRETEKLREKSTVISDQIKELQNKILEVGGVKLRAIQSKYQTTKGLVDMANEAITKAEVGQAKAERDAEKLEKAIVASTAKMEEANAELEVVQGDLEACQADLNVIRGHIQKAQDGSIDHQEELAVSKAKLDEKLTDINAFRALEMDIKQKIKENMGIQKDCEDKLRYWRKKLAELELVYVDDEDDDEDEEENPAPEGEDGEEVTVSTKKAKPNSQELVEYSPDELEAVNRDVMNAEITQLEEEIGKAKPNLNVLTEYRKREAEFLDRAKDMESITSRRDVAKQAYDELRNQRLKQFMTGFTAISSHLKEMYQMITMGGNAEIELIDSMDPFSEGVVLSIMPPKKSWRAIANLSGGEKTLASLALVFALHVYKPTPLYFMDEIDAALDFKNVSIVANYIQSKTQAAQFIVISLRNDMFELAHRLVGIYKTSNCTKSIAIDNKDLRTQAVPKRQAMPSTPGASLRNPIPATPSTITRGPFQTPKAKDTPETPTTGRTVTAA